MANEARIREVIQYIELHPEQWNQTKFYHKTTCGTTGCLAGLSFFLANEMSWIGEWTDLRSFAKDAKEYLELNDSQAYKIFYFMNICDECGDTNIEPKCDHVGKFRHPTIEEYKKLITTVTGVTFKENDD